MAVEPLIDIGAIDLSACVHDREGIGRYNPHRGEVALLDKIVCHDELCSLGIALKEVRDDEWWVDGHIPGRPLMPGVLMVEAGAQLASFLYYKRSGMRWFAGFTRIEETTFRGHVVPGDDLYIVCKSEKYQLRRFISRVQGFVNGELCFAGKLTGMAFPKLGDVQDSDTSEAMAR
jgi:3-hydroxyacyl-[acyl-carrier-protein] dehydratase